MRVGLFIPCFVDQFYPEAGRGAVAVLEKHGVDVAFGEDAICCGQPAWNAGIPDEARTLARNLEKAFSDHEYVVAPSASCVAMVRQHHARLLDGEKGEVSPWPGKLFELCEFLWEILGVRRIEGRFSRRVGLHVGCHGLRNLGLGNPSERVHQRRPDPVRELLLSLEGLELVELERADECCGFGGTFAWSEAGVSTRMGEDRLADHARAGAEVLASTDSSCLMHLGGLLRRRGENWPVMHVAEILAGFELSSG